MALVEYLNTLTHYQYIFLNIILLVICERQQRTSRNRAKAKEEEFGI